MYPRGRGKGTPLGGSNTDPEAPSFNESLSASINANVSEAATASTSASPPSQPQQLQQAIRPRRSPQLPYPTIHTSNATINLGSGRGDAGLYPPPKPHQLPLPPQPQPSMPLGTAGGSGGPGGPYYGGGSPSVSHNFMQRGAVPSYDQSGLPPPPPPGVYEGDTPCFQDNVMSTPTSPPSFNAAANYNTAFSHHSRTSSTNNNTAIIAGGERSLSGTQSGGPAAGADYRPPPMYGDVPLGGAVANPLNVVTNNITNNGNSSFSRVTATGSGQGGGARLPPYAAGSPVGSSVSSLQNSNAQGVANSSVPVSSAGGSSFSIRHYDGAGPGSPMPVTAPIAPGCLPCGPSGLKITVGGNMAVVSNSAAPVTPLLSSPPQTAGLSLVEPSKGSRRTQTENKTLTTGNNVNANSNNNSSNSNVNNSDGNNLTSSNAGNAEADAEVSASPSKPTVEQAEARYQYLYEEFRKVSRVRSKLLEDVERLKREVAAAMEEVQYYRQKTLSAAEEREAILHDYHADVHYLLRLVDALASDVLAAHGHRKAAEASAERGIDDAATEKVVVPSTPQHAIDVAASRLATLLPRQSAFSTATTALDGSSNNVGNNANTIIPPETPGLAEHLGLHHGMWVSRMSKTTSEVLVEEEQVSSHDLNDCSQSTPALTPAQQQDVLLRDEMRDVHRNTHAAMSSYMTSLDYGSAPAAMQRGFSTGPQGVRHNSSERFSQRQFTSEYRGLHLHVDVPRFHAQSAAEGAAGLDLPLGQSKDGASSSTSGPMQTYAPQRSRANPNNT